MSWYREKRRYFAIYQYITQYIAIYHDISRYIPIYRDILRYIGSKIGDISDIISDISPILDPIYRDISMIYHDILIYWIISCNISRYIMKWYIAIYHIGDISRDISIYSIYSIDYWQNWYIRKYYFRVIYRYITNITKIYHWYIEYFCKKIWFEIFKKYFALFYRIRYIEIYHFYEYIAKKTQMWYIMIYPNISHM